MRRFAARFRPAGLSLPKKSFQPDRLPTVEAGPRNPSEARHRAGLFRFRENQIRRPSENAFAVVGNGVSCESDFPWSRCTDGLRLLADARLVPASGGVGRIAPNGLPSGRANLI